MNLVLTSEKANELKALAKTYLLSKDGRLFTLGNSTIELKSEERLFSKKIKTTFILTDVELLFYYPVLKRWSRTTNAEEFIEYTNFYKCRERWLELKEALEANGLYITKAAIPEPLNQNECLK